jgi:hypothetical protein
VRARASNPSTIGPFRLFACGAFLIAACAVREPTTPVAVPQAPQPRTETSAAPPAATTAPSAPAPSAPGAPAPASDEERARLVAWLKTRVPGEGEIVDRPGAPVGIAHLVREGDSLAKVADLYVDMTDIYLARDLQKAIADANSLGDAGLKPGTRVTIPAVVARAPKSADEERLGWPEDKALRGLYVRGSTAATPLFMGLLERMAARGMNVIVLDAKDYDGLVTYRSQIPLVLETGAAKDAPIRDLARTVRFAHAKGIRVAMRVSCFEDEFMARAKPELAPISKWKRPYKIGWFDPANEGARAYLLEMVKEAMDAGVDEVQLDYIRYPVLGIKGADFDATKGKVKKTVIIRDFVRRVHELTKARSVPLSLDIFGVVADGDRADIDMLGQDPVMLAPECEALSPMVYPSHYRSGYNGFEVPGDHPEIVGIGTKKILVQIRKFKKQVVVRPWLQAVEWHSPAYGPQYIAAEVKHATQAGSTGWLMWNPAQTYTVTWNAIPKLSD